MVLESKLHKDILPEEIDGLVELFSERSGILGVETIRLPDSESAVLALMRLAGDLGTDRAVFSTELLGIAPLLATSLSNSSFVLEAAKSPEHVRDSALGVTTAVHAIAETGSLLTSESTLADRAVSMLSLCCVFLLPTSDLLRSLDQACHVLRCLALGPNGAYSTLITGPSRTADIEMSLTVGVQGPARIVVFLVDSLT